MRNPKWLILKIKQQFDIEVEFTNRLRLTVLTRKR